MRRGLALAVLWLTLAGTAAAQRARDSLVAGSRAYDVAEYGAAIPLLSAGLNPVGPRDSLWVAGLHKLVHSLLERGADSVAALWLRWALRQDSTLVPDQVNFPPSVVAVFDKARRFVQSGSPGDSVTRTTWIWGGVRRGRQPRRTASALQIAPGPVRVNALVEGVGPLTVGQNRPLPPASYTIVASAEGYYPARVVREVLPGITTVLDFRLRPLPPPNPAYLYIASAPWGTAYLDGGRLGYTPIAARPIAAGTHCLRAERSGIGVFDTTLTVAHGERVRLGTRVWARASTPDPALISAAAAFDSTETEHGVDLLRQALPGLDSAAAPAVRARARVLLAAAEWALGFPDSAAIDFREAVHIDPFFEPEPENLNPDLSALLIRARRATVVVGLRVPGDTTIQPPAESWPLTVAVGKPGRVRIIVTSETAGARDSVVVTRSVERVTTIPLALVGADSLPLTTGSYALTGEFMSADGDSARARVAVDIARQAVDTQAAEPPPAPGVFRPEWRRGPADRRGLVRGLVIGAAAGVIPVVLANSQLDRSALEPRALAVGAAIGAVTLTSIVLSRPRFLIPENVDYNRSLRAGWEERNRAIAAANEALVRRAPIRVRANPP